MRNDFVER